MITQNEQKETEEKARAFLIDLKELMKKHHLLLDFMNTTEPFGTFRKRYGFTGVHGAYNGEDVNRKEQFDTTDLFPDCNFILKFNKEPN